MSANSDDGDAGSSCILYTDTSGRPVIGDRAVLNTPDWQMTLLPLGSEANLLIQTSAKAFTDNNAVLLTRQATELTLRQIEYELRERGLHCDLMNDAHIRRLDIARNVALSHNVPAYVGLFREMPTTARMRPHMDGEGYFRVGSGGWQLALYDKGQEQAEKATKSRAALPSSKVLRGELRFLKSREIASRFDVKKLSPRQLVEKERFAQVPEMFRDALQSTLLAEERPPRGHMAMSDETVKLWAEVQKRVATMAAPGTAKYYRLMHHAMLAGAAGADGARQWFSENLASGDTEAAKRRQQRFNKEVKQAGAIFDATEDESTPATRTELYTELRTELLKE
jgi:flagellar basal body rod protein FlgB